MILDPVRERIVLVLTRHLSIEFEFWMTTNELCVSNVPVVLVSITIRTIRRNGD